MWLYIYMKQDIDLYSDPNQVYKNAVELLGDDVDIRFSTRKDKKYMVLNPYTNKWVHFGQMGFEDYTKHKDDIRRHKFIIRNNKWLNAEEYTPAYLSIYLLW